MANAFVSCILQKHGFDTLLLKFGQYLCLIKKFLIICNFIISAISLEIYSISIVPGIY